MSDCELLDAIERRVVALERRGDDVEWRERKLLDAARQWARLTSLSYCLDADGNRILLCAKDARDSAEVFAAEMRLHALDLLRASAG